MSAEEPWRSDENTPPQLPPGIRALFGMPRPPTPEERQALEARYATLIVLGNDHWPSLPAFNAAASCAKCGFTNVAMNYHEAPDPDQGHPSTCLEHVGSHEHMVRQCTRCGFLWWERVLEVITLSPASARRPPSPRRRRPWQLLLRLFLDRRQRVA